MTVAAVIPTRARLTGLQAAVASLRAQEHRPDAILVVDNESTDGTAAWLAEQEDVTALALRANTGAPGGFQAGIDAALAAGHDWIWLIDDDCVADPAALAALLAFAAEGTGIDLRRRPDGALRRRPRGDRAPGRRGDAPLAAGGEADWAPFAGLLLAAEACRAAGPLRDGLVPVARQHGVLACASASPAGASRSRRRPGSGTRRRPSTRGGSGRARSESPTSPPGASTTTPATSWRCAG